MSGQLLLRGERRERQFGRKSVADAFLHDHAEGWRKWFAWLCPWDDSRVQTQRIVWVKISGVPVHCWDQNNFDVIASRVLIPNECSKEAVDLSHGKVCILARLDLMFNVYHEVVWKNTSFIIRVQEDGDWAPPCVIDESSDSDSEEDGFVDRNSLGNMDDCEDGDMFNNLHDENMEVDRNDDEISCGRCNNDYPATMVVDTAEEEQGKGIGDSEGFEEAVPAVQCDDSISKVEGNDVVGHVKHDDTDGMSERPNDNVNLGSDNVGISFNEVSGEESSSGPVNDVSSIGGSSRRRSFSARRLSHSICFKDVAWASHGRLSKGKSLCSKDRLRSVATCSDSISMRSCDREVEKTVELGENLGFRLKDSKSSLRAVIEGEGVLKCAQ
ncbi:hypothetical protein L2E82_44526 [Cichorium intybus]|uniref:Uncharacterized protein n=1 Tax=Cichorium intybus TaxID=13427 RepID=A0ACB8ZRT0_CICIN|nr:hypothetical protein L2E82_44526 [Cichorium intybus]